MSDSSESDGDRRVTIYDVAEAAGVAPSTVSRAFSRPRRVNAQTGQRIREVAEALGYRSKPVPRGERGEANHILAFVVADVTNPIYAQIMRGFQSEAMQHGYTVLLMDTQEDEVGERQAVDAILNMVDGVALASARMSDSSINQIVKVRPVVAANREMAGIPSVITDTDRGVRQALEELARFGHTRVTYLSGPTASWADGVRWRAISTIGKEMGFQVRRIGPNAPSLEGGAEAGKQWFYQRTGAVIGFNDLVAVGFMKFVHRAGMTVPNDVSVVGVDNSIAAFLTTPTLASIAPPAKMLGVRAARALISQLKHRSAPSAELITVPTKFVTRDSIGPAPTLD